MNPRMKVLQHLSHADEPLTPGQLRSALGLEAQPISAALFTLTRSGHAERIEGENARLSTYVITEAGKAQAAAEATAPSVKAPPQKRSKKAKPAAKAPPPKPRKAIARVARPAPVPVSRADTTFTTDPVRRLIAAVLVDPRPLTLALRTAVADAVRLAA